MKKIVAIAIIGIILSIGLFAVINYFNQPKHTIAPWIFIKNPRVECIRKQNDSYLLSVTAVVNYSWPFIVDGKEKLSTKIEIKITKYLNKTEFGKYRGKGGKPKNLIVDRGEIFMNVPYYHTIWLNETFTVPSGNYTIGIQPYILVENRWWGTSWVKGHQERAEPCPIRIG